MINLRIDISVCAARSHSSLSLSFGISLKVNIKGEWSVEEEEK